MAKQIVKSGSVAQPIGPYSLAVKTNGLVFVSGTVGWRPDGSIPSDVREQCRQMYENVRRILESAGSGLDHVVSTTTYLVNASDYRALNEVRAQYFKHDPPASAVVVVKELVRPELLVEVEAVAEIPPRRASAPSGARRSARTPAPRRRR
jgi:2-iminobutanoate/2-iminopropanoate deaminase